MSLCSMEETNCHVALGPLCYPEPIRVNQFLCLSLSLCTIVVQSVCVRMCICLCVCVRVHLSH